MSTARTTGMLSTMPPSSIGTPSTSVICATYGSDELALTIAVRRRASDFSVRYSARPVRQLVVTTSNVAGLAR